MDVYPADKDKKGSGRTSVCDIIHLLYHLPSEHRMGLALFITCQVARKIRTVKNPVKNSGILSAHIGLYLFINIYRCISLCILMAYFDRCLSVACTYRCVSMCYIDRLILISVYRLFYRSARINKCISIAYINWCLTLSLISITLYSLCVCVCVCRLLISICVYRSLMSIGVYRFLVHYQSINDRLASKPEIKLQIKLTKETTVRQTNRF